MSDFIKESTVLIISTRPSHRTSVKKLLLDLGVSNSRIEGVTDFNQAKEKLLQGVINILITDDEIGSQGTPLELLKLHQQNNPKAYARLTILMPGGETEQLRDEFLRIGGDLIIEKPFTSATFLTPFKKLIESKYALTIDEMMALDIEEALIQNDRDKALEAFNLIKNSNSHSASYSSGMISMFDNNFHDAYIFFQRSLQKKYDFKVVEKMLCSGLKINKHKELNPYVDKFITKNSLSSQVATDVARVVVYNKKFSLLDQIRIREDESKIPLAAGLVVASSFYLDRGETQKSIDCAIRAIENSSNKSSIIFRAMELLLQAGGMEKAQRVFDEMNLKALASADSNLIQSLENLLGVS